MTDVNDRNDRYEEPQVFDLGDASTFFLGDAGEAEDSAKVVACTQCAMECVESA